MRVGVRVVGVDMLAAEALGNFEEGWRGVMLGVVAVVGVSCCVDG